LFYQHRPFRIAFAVAHGIHAMADLLPLTSSDDIVTSSLIVAFSKNLPVAYPLPSILVPSDLCSTGDMASLFFLRLELHFLKSGFRFILGPELLHPQHH
jgi:hypothetical protein